MKTKYKLGIFALVLAVTIKALNWGIAKLGF